MANPNFGSILDSNPEETKAPALLPVGTYLTVIQGLPRQDKSTLKKTEFLEFSHKILSAMDDVDTDQLAEIGPIVDLKPVKNTFYLTEDAMFMLKDFLTLSCKIEMQDTYRPMIEQTPGMQVLIKIKHTPSQDGTRMYANVASTAPVE